MKCLSVQQPWAQLIVTGRKDVENRTWQTKHRGPLLIHAGLRVDRNALEYLEQRGHVFKGLVRGAIIGVVQVFDCLPGHKVKSVWHEAGTWGWYLKNSMKFQRPIDYRGNLYLFNVPDDVVPEMDLYLSTEVKA